jgi:hypothetical protein
MLVRLIYASTATENVGMTEFKVILQQSQVNNNRRDLTGVLAFNSKIFLQGLEGSREEINELYTRLLRDTRHHTVAVLEYAEIEEREWGQWSMGFAAPSADNRALFLKYSGQSVFNPYAMRGGAVKKLLGELAGKSITMTVPTSLAAPVPSAITPMAPRTPLPPLATTPMAPRTPLPPLRSFGAAPAVAPARPSVAASPVPPTTAAAPTAPGLLDRLLNR